MENTRLLSDYEKTAMQQIHNWKNPKVTWLDKAMEVANWPIEKASDLVMQVPGLGPVMEQFVIGLIGVLSDLAHWTVRPEAIYDEYRSCGHASIRNGKDLLELDLEHVDKVIGWLGASIRA